MDDVRGDFLGPPHSTTPAAVIANKNIINASISNTRCCGRSLVDAVMMMWQRIPSWSRPGKTQE